MTDRPRTDQGWFEELYAGTDDPPWQRAQQRISLERWVEAQGLDGGGTKRAAVVGCGLGTDAEYIASKNYNTLGFDLSPTAIRRAQELHPDSRVEYVAADLLRLPSDWRQAFDLVVEVWTVQAIPDPPRTQAIEAIASLVAPGGDLIVIAIARDDDGPDSQPDDGPPWFLNRRTINNFSALTGLTADDVHLGPDPEAPDRRQCWTAHFSRRWPD
jgi:SAM-dependent methyltransferase